MGFEKKSRPMASAYRADSQTITTAQVTYVSWTDQLYDTDAMFTPTDTKIYAKRFTGYYLINGQVAWSSNTTGIRIVWIDVNGTQLATMDQTPVNGSNTRMNLSMMRYLNIDDYVRLGVYHTRGANLDVTGVDGQTYLTVAHLSGR